ncbi:MAG: acyltransferase [Myxococcota bacterium]|nr:acyltransferase [Myxococcota bacterium]
MRQFTTHGSGKFKPEDIAVLGENVIFEDGVRIWHPETLTIGTNVYIGHDAMLKGYYKGHIAIGNNTWIGQGVYMHGAGGIDIGERVGMGPFVKIITSFHEMPELDTSILDGPLQFAGVHIGPNCDIGIGAIILPGITIGTGVQIGAGAIVTKDVPDYAVAAGNPARILRMRTQ